MNHHHKQRYLHPVALLLLILALATLLGACSNEEVETQADGEAATAPQRYGPDHQGSATYYHADGRGNCSFDASEDHYVAALNNVDYAEAALCGAYLRVEGPQGEVVVRVTDRCPGCKEGGLDLSKEAFAAIAPLTAGRIEVQWHVVSGPLDSDITLRYQKGSSRYWSALQLLNHRWPVKSVEILPTGGNEWIALQRRRYNYFVHSRPIADGPLQARITSVMDDVVELELPSPQGAAAIDTKRQFGRE